MSLGTPLPSAYVACAFTAMHVHILEPVHDLHTAGYLHGQRAVSEILDFMRTDEVASLLNFTRTPAGKRILHSLRAATTESVPWLAEEIAGISEGAGLTDYHLDDFWAVNLISELEAAMQQSAVPARRGDHCSDVMVRRGSDAGALNGSVLLGHNEDWSAAFRPLMYWVVYNAAPGAQFAPLGGLVYPGQAPGFAVTFTPSVWTTQNSLFPHGLNTSGVCVVGAVRAALKAADSAAAVAEGISKPGQAYGMSVQVVGPHVHGTTFAANVEVAGAVGRAAVAVLGCNLTHFNGYKHLPGVQFTESDSSKHRQAAVDGYPVPRCKGDVVERIGDSSDAEFPVYRPQNTMISTLFDSSDGSFAVWYDMNPRDATTPSWLSTLKEVFALSNLPHAQ